MPTWGTYIAAHSTSSRTFLRASYTFEDPMMAYNTGRLMSCARLIEITPQEDTANVITRLPWAVAASQVESHID
ncbi:MAG: hypothetical protein R3C68_08430 [Myxococcota bacterium]